MEGTIKEGGMAKLTGRDLVEAGRWYKELEEEFRASGELDRADYFNTLRNEMIYIVTHLIAIGIEDEITNYTLPTHGIKALGFDSNNLVEEVQEAQVLSSKLKNLGHEVKVCAVRDNPAVRAKMNAYQSRKVAYAKDNKLREFELLFAKDKDDEVPLGTQGIRNHIDYYLRNGKRLMLIPYLINIVFEHKEIDGAEAHNFLDRFKSVYGITEPVLMLKKGVTKNSITGNWELPYDAWLKISFRAGKGVLCEKYVMRREVTKTDILFDLDMQEITLITDVIKWRKATVEEVRTEVLSKLKLHSAPYKITMDIYGKKFKMFDEVEYDED